MNADGIDTWTVLKVLLAVVALVIGFVVLGSVIRFVGRLIWMGVGVLVLVVLVLVALKLLEDVL
ncbi:MAG: hypothetical protein U5K70_03475 [Halodesulfurarchaeum sp.]|nr:hypothetical protein [Halodesulfurarchaeum sp.]